MRDIIVIGAGPAGATAARHAARMGLSTLLIDKDRFPRHKPCGGGVTMRAMRGLDFPLPERLLERRLMGARIRQDGASVEVRLDKPVAYCVNRTLFDAHLLQKAREAGADALLETRVDALVPTGEAGLGHVEVRLADGRAVLARYALVAEGATGRLKRLVRRPDAPERRWLCLCTDSPTPDHYANTDLMDIHCGLTPTGYAWIFPRNGVANVGLGALTHHFADPRASLQNHLDESGFAMGKSLAAHPIPLGGVRRNLAAQNILLAGDAGGFADAFSCEGIAYAILSGAAAARAVADALFGSASLESAYARRCRPILTELRGSYLAFRFASALPRPLYTTLVTDARCLAKFLEVAAGRSTYRSFLARLTAELPRLGWKAFRR